MKIKRSLQVFFTILLTLCLVFSFIPDFQNTIHYGGIDLRTRVVGTRVALMGKDPYFFRWRSGMSDQLIDPDVQRNAQTSKLSVTPSVLELHAPFAQYPYFQQRIIWLFLQWLALIASLIVFLYKSKSQLQSTLFCVLSLCFANSLFWRLHIERGQIYILIVLLLSIAFLLYQEKSHLRKLLSGVIIGVSITLRPPLILMMLPFFIQRQFSMIIGSLLGLFIGVWPLSQMDLWKSYFLAMARATQYISSHGIASPELNKIRIGNIYPEWIEGLNNLTKTKNITATNSSIQNIFLSFNIEDIYNIKLALLLIVIVVMSLFLTKNISKNTSAELLFLSGSIFYLFAEFFIPAPRYSYNDVQWLFPLFLIFLDVKNRNFYIGGSTLLLMTSLVLCLGLCPWIPKFLLISIYMMAFYVGLTTLQMLATKNHIPRLSQISN
jgi:hypothetical protein